MEKSFRFDSICTNTCMTKDGLDSYEELETFIQKSTKNKLIVSFISNNEIENTIANIGDTVSCFILHSSEIQMNVSDVSIELHILFSNGNTKTINNNIDITMSSGILRGSYIIIEDDMTNDNILENAVINANVSISNRNEILQSKIINLVI